MTEQGFPPLFDQNSKVLILGSFPSVKSREQQFYYGNKQNRFWSTLQQVFGGKADTVQQKRQLCLDNGIALWDVVASCNVVGSMDSSITNYTLVDLQQVLAHCNVTKILCNGALAHKLASSCNVGNLPLVKMPSTSPANTRFDVSVWIKELKNN